MVSYYHTEQISNPSMTSDMPPNLLTMNPVKNLVCSPDLPVFSSTPSGTATAASFAAATTGTIVESLSNGTEDKLFQCQLCHKTFDQKNLYQSHLRSHSKDGEDPYQCDKCEKTFAVPARLTRHYRTHTGEKPFKCEYCEKSFSVKENLSVHRRIHTKERPYKCDVCERAFEHSGKLHRHMRIHTGERPHKCNVCSKTFIQSGQLVIHTRTHTGEKPYVCKSCGKGFTCSKQLKVHTRTHTGEKPYSCDICGKSFGYNHVLKLHQVSHYGEKVYKCTLCNETFSSKKTMELHIKTHSDSSPPATSSPTPSSSSTSSSYSSLSSSTSNGISSAGDSQVESVKEISQSNSGIINDVLPMQPFLQKYNNKEQFPRKNSDNCVPCSHNEIYPNHRDFSYYLFPREQHPPQSLVTTTITGPMHIMMSESFEKHAINPVANIEQPSNDYLYSDISTSPYSLTQFAFSNNSRNIRKGDEESEPTIHFIDRECPSLMNLSGNDARRRVEAVLEAVEEESQREYKMNFKEEEEMLKSPSSNPVSPESLPLSSNPSSPESSPSSRNPSPASSPDPLDLVVIPVRETLILPPRKRCKMILQSMESERSAQRESIIHFARAS